MVDETSTTTSACPPGTAVATSTIRSRTRRLLVRYVAPRWTKRGRQAAEIERLRALGEMAVGVAHDVNNLLLLIQGHAELAAQPDAAPSSLERIRQAAADGAAIMQRLQAFASAEAPTTVLLLGPSDLNGVVVEAIETTRPLISTRAPGQAIAVELDLLPDLPPILGNPTALRQALINLILNALDAMPEGGRLTIQTRTLQPGDADSDRRIVCHVKDTGVGMTDAVRQRCLDRFFTTKGSRGSGLGLSQVGQIIAQHRGELTINSAVGVGSTFSLTFLPSPAAAAPPAAGRSPARQESLNVLVVDDDASVAEMLETLLEEEGHRVTRYTDSVAAIRQLESGNLSADLLVTDLMLPNLNGLDLAERAKRTNPTMTIALLTGSTTDLDVETARARGVDHVLPKPGGLNQLRHLTGALQVNQQSVC